MRSWESIPKIFAHFNDVPQNGLSCLVMLNSSAHILLADQNSKGKDGQKSLLPLLSPSPIPFLSSLFFFSYFFSPFSCFCQILCSYRHVSLKPFYDTPFNSLFSCFTNLFSLHVWFFLCLAFLLCFVLFCIFNVNSARFPVFSQQPWEAWQNYLYFLLFLLCKTGMELLGWVSRMVGSMKGINTRGNLFLQHHLLLPCCSMGVYMRSRDRDALGCLHPSSLTLYKAGWCQLDGIYLQLV